MIEVSLCSRKGLFIWADNRLYADPMPNQDPNHVLILVSRYSDQYDWKPMATGLTEAFKDWPGPSRLQDRLTRPHPAGACGMSRSAEM
jgi:hypothetical protein